MDLGAMIRMVSSMNLDDDARQKLLRAARGEGGEEVNEAIEALARALGVVDEDGDVREEAVKNLVENTGLEAQREERLK